MAIEYTIPQLLRLVGIRGYSPRLANAVNQLLAPENEIEYRQAKQEVTRQITGYDNVSVYDDTNEYKGEIFGLPIFMPVIMEAFDNSVKDFFIDSAIVELNRTKNIVTTAVQGRDNTIKEFINNGDFTIKISGIIASDGIDYPKDKVLELHKYLQAEQSIKVINDKMNALEIYEIVITDYSLPPTPFTNIQPFSFNALSEKPVELIIDEE